MYGIRSSHIFEIPRTSNEKHNILIESLGFRPKNSVFQIKNFEILGFLPIDFEILGGILSKTPSIWKTWHFD